LTGLRPLTFLSQPALYGTNIVRLTTQTTVDVDSMKDARGGSGRGLIGGVLAKARAAITSAVNSIGLFPYAVYPTTLTNDFTYTLRSSGFSSQNKRRTILSNSKGTGLGALIKSAVTAPMGGEDQGAQIGGSAVSAIKSAGRKLLLGDGRLQDPQVLWEPNKMKYTNSYTYSTTMLRSRDPQFSQKYKNDLSSVLYDYDEITLAELAGVFRGIIPPFPLSITPDSYKTFGKAQKLEIDNVNLLKRLQKSAPPKDAADTSRNFSNLQVNYANQKNSDRGGRYADTLNTQLPYKGDAPKIDDTSIEDMDFVRLKFSSPSRANNKGISALFRATITGLTETITPTWEPNKFIGNPFNFYTYSSIEKTLGFTFKVYSSNQMEHIAMWERLNFLTSLAYPQGYIEGIVISPFIRFTMGDLYRDKDCVIESLTYTVSDDTTWEIGIDQLERDEQQTWIRTGNGDRVVFSATDDNNVEDYTSKDIKNYKLPSVVEVAITLKIVDDRKSISGYKFYSQSPIIQTKAQTLP
jgi:hypothetical protein